MAPRAKPEHGISLREATRVWAYIGVNSFGGPAGQIAVMHREIVERRNWVSERRFLHSLNYCMILPGPEAQQLATYIGWLMHGTLGGVIAGSLFVIPGFIAMLGLAAAFVTWGSVLWVAGLFAGIQAAVVPIVAQAVIRIGSRTLRTRALQVVAVLSFILIAFLNVPFPLIIIAAGLFGWFAGRRRSSWFPLGGHGTNDGADATPALLSDDDALDRADSRRALRAGLVCAVLWLVPVVALFVTLGAGSIFTQQSELFSKSAIVTFGGAYAVLGYIAQQAVDRYGWITAGDMAVGLGLAETTPGPLIMVVEFVGFLAAYSNPGSLPPLVAGTIGAVITVWVTFVPCFMFIFLGAPYVEKLRHNQSIVNALTAVGASVAGVVLNLAVWFALHTAFDTVTERMFGPISIAVPDLSTVNLSAIVIALIAAVFIFRLRIGILKVLGVCAVLGAAAALLGFS
jgi:chromate transporter